MPSVDNHRIRLDVTTSYGTRGTSASNIANYLDHVTDNVVGASFNTATYAVVDSMPTSTASLNGSPDVGVDATYLEVDGTKRYLEVQFDTTSPGTATMDDYFAAALELRSFAGSVYQASP